MTTSFDAQAFIDDARAKLERGAPDLAEDERLRRIVAAAYERGVRIGRELSYVPDLEERRRIVKYLRDGAYGDGPTLHRAAQEIDLAEHLVDCSEDA